MRVLALSFIVSGLLHGADETPPSREKSVPSKKATPAPAEKAKPAPAKTDKADTKTGPAKIDKLKLRGLR